MITIDSLISRLRAAMNLLLVTSLIAMWASTDSGLLLKKMQSALEKIHEIEEYYAEEIADLSESDMRKYDFSLLRKEIERLPKTEKTTLTDLQKILNDAETLNEESKQYPESLIELDRLVKDIKEDYLVTNAASTTPISELGLQVRVPVLEISFPANQAVTVIVVGTAIVMLYIMSTLSTLSQLTPLAKRGQGVDLVFFHCGILGYLLAIIWTAMPAIVVLTALFKKILAPLIAIPLLILLSALSGRICFKAWHVRKMIHEKLFEST